jgi:hypothetical protein
MRRSFIFLLLFSVALAVWAVPARAVSYNFTNISNNSLDNSCPQINASGQVVWFGFDGSDDEIYYYDTRVAGETRHQITNNSLYDYYPQINANGQIVWVESDGNDYEIYYYDTRVAGETPHRLTDNSLNDEDAQINANGQIVWEAWDASSGRDQIYYYDTRVTNETPHQLSTGGGDNPEINANGQIVWGGYGEIYYYDTRVAGETPHALAMHSSDPQINDNGQIVWVEWTASSNHDEIYYYDTRVSGETPHRLTNNSFDDEGPQINATGQVVWYGYGALGTLENTSEIYYYDTRVSGETPHQLTNNSYNDYYPRINGNGQIVWGGNEGIYYYDTRETGETPHLISDNVLLFSLQLNAKGQIVYYAQSSGEPANQIYLGAPVSQYSRYDFTYYYNNGSGDYYSGSVYALTGYDGYQVGYTQSVTDENGQAGYYSITAATDLGTDGSKADQVYVSSYYDAESGNTYTPVNSGSAVGTAYLGSEHDYIIQSGISDFYFGGGYYEADTGAYSRYNFYYWYSDGSGDCYAGYVYAPTGWFTAGTYLYHQPLPMGGAALGGSYYITSATAGYTSAYDKQSYISTYYDYHNSAWTACGVNQGGATTAGSIYVADRSQAAETGYAIYSSSAKYFDTATSAAFTYAASLPAASQAVWAAYWSQTPGLPDEEM